MMMMMIMMMMMMIMMTMKMSDDDDLAPWRSHKSSYRKLAALVIELGISEALNCGFLNFTGYVVRWKYCVKLTGVKTLKGKQSKYEDVGRDKVAYFFWQGKDSTLNEKGTAALMTVELDSDKGPQVGN